MREITNQELQLKAVQYRRQLLHYIYEAGAGHTGGSLSCLDILNVLYNRILRVSPSNWSDPKRDRYVQSKGHSVEALYVVLAGVGFFPADDLLTMCHYKSHYVGHPTRKIPGIEMNTGGLGHGLSISAGMAKAGKLDRADYRVYTLLGDGELAEGSNWEAAMWAAHNKLDNLTAILDYNQLQITGPTSEVCSNEPIDEKFASFGWHVRVIDGHDYDQLTEAISKPSDDGRPTCVIAKTIKGRGVSFMENVLKWHHGVPSAAEYEQAVKELDAAEHELMETAR